MLRDGRGLTGHVDKADGPCLPPTAPLDPGPQPPNAASGSRQAWWHRRSPRPGSDVAVVLGAFVRGDRSGSGGLAGPGRPGVSPAPARPSRRDPRRRCPRLSLAPRRLFPSIQPVSGQRAEQRTGETEPAASFTTHFKKLCGFSTECFEWRRSNPCILKLPVHPRPAASGPPLHRKHPSVTHPSVTPLQDKGFLLDPAWVRLPRAVFDWASTSGPAFSLPRPVVTRISPSQQGQDPHHV